jgi:hypothetical protein
LLLLGCFILWWTTAVAKGENLVRNWLDFAWFFAFLLFGCLGWQAWRGRNLVQNWLDFAWSLLFNCYRSVLLSYHGVSYSYRSPWILYWLSWYGMVVLSS